ncbi:MAG TPA: GYF domain-containing protein [Chthonomonadaceae bacterium]|nr:GYF domain-containing protein [Chthonomonadaceae bacterium]
MQYYVLDASGQRYGPATIDQLKQWILEGRVAASTMLESVETGQRQPAYSVEGLSFGAPSPTPAAPVGYTPMPPSGYAGAPVQGYPGAGMPAQGYAGMPPQGYPAAGMYGPMQNTSGTNGLVPPEVEAMGWSWGAFGVNWIWCLAHNQVLLGICILILNFIPFIGGLVTLGIAIYLGINGNKLAWQKRRYESLQQFQTVERIWGKWGIGLFILSILLVIVYIVLIINGVSSGHTTYGTYPSSP